MCPLGKGLRKRGASSSALVPLSLPDRDPLFLWSLADTLLTLSYTCLHSLTPCLHLFKLAYTCLHLAYNLRTPCLPSLTPCLHLAYTRLHLLTPCLHLLTPCLHLAYTRLHLAYTLLTLAYLHLAYTRLHLVYLQKWLPLPPPPMNATFAFGKLQGL